MHVFIHNITKCWRLAHNDVHIQLFVKVFMGSHIFQWYLLVLHTHQLFFDMPSLCMLVVKFNQIVVFWLQIDSFRLFPFFISITLVLQLGLNASNRPIIVLFFIVIFVTILVQILIFFRWAAPPPDSIQISVVQIYEGNGIRLFYDKRRYEFTIGLDIDLNS